MRSEAEILADIARIRGGVAAARKKSKSRDDPNRCAKCRMRTTDHDDLRPVNYEYMKAVYPEVDDADKDDEYTQLHKEPIGFLPCETTKPRLVCGMCRIEMAGKNGDKVRYTSW